MRLADVLFHGQGLSTGRICDGYGDLDSVVAPASRRKPAAQVVARALENPYQDGREARYLQFFLEVTAAQFTTFFRDDVWISTVLQIAQSEPCIRHAMVALSFHHERYARRSVDVADARFAAQQYGFAIRELTSTTEQSPTYVHLLSCLLFIWAEVSAGLVMLQYRFATSTLLTGCAQTVQGNYESAINLFRYGRNMAREIVGIRGRSPPGAQIRDHSTEHHVLLDRIIAHFSSLAVETSLV